VILAHGHDGEAHTHDVVGDQASADPAQVGAAGATSVPGTPRAIAKTSTPVVPSLGGFLSFLAHNSSLPLLVMFAIVILQQRARPVLPSLPPPPLAGMAPPTPPPRGLVAA
jgi:hypothetical protein